MFIMAKCYRVTPVPIKIKFSIILKTLNIKGYFNINFLYLYACSS